ncbi:pyridoxal phosphate-dependent aminotransferase [Ihubacter sp. rT4E-8]|uniref:pyridoxal phosphate-dependent aminotransferase n=1 Tax=unclassified Ihubacter TaxID=2633299 RepID=UPI00137A5EEB
MFGSDKIRDLLKVDVKSYADHTPKSDESTLDCSLGINPYGFPDKAAEVISNFDVNRLYQYPCGDEAKKAVVDYWAGKADIEGENLVMTDGSISALCLLVNVFAQKDSELVCFLPTFTSMVEYARMMGMKVSGIATSQNENFREDVDQLIDAITEKTSLVYIDNPNNPTGQTLCLDALRKVLEKCEKLGVYCIIDEAYADFIPVEESAVNLGAEFKCMISVRTFSKGWGLAGARAGYIITNKELVEFIGKISNPYMMNEVSRALTCEILKNTVQPCNHGIDFAIIKGALRDACGKQIIMAETDDRVPICLLRHVDETMDLQEYLMKGKILTCSGQEFEPMGKNCVRLRVPTISEAGRLIEAFKRL